MVNKLALPALILVPFFLVVYYFLGSNRGSTPTQTSSSQPVPSQLNNLTPSPSSASPEGQVKPFDPTLFGDLVVAASPSAASFVADKISLMIIKEGSGSAQTKSGDNIQVHYAGFLLNGQKFDSSLDRGQPFTFALGQGQVIKGWDLGLVSMKVGEIRRLIIPPFLAYGDQANGPIPANSPLFFEVQLLKIN